MLDGMTIAITRSRDDASEFVRLSEQNGAIPITLPTIELVSKGERIVDEFMDSIRLHDPDYSVFMSSKAVRLLFETARQSGRHDDLKLAVANTAVVSVGPKTTAALEGEGIRVNHQPAETFSSVGVGEEFTRINAAGKSAIIPRSSASTPFLKDLLGKIGVKVVELYLYDVCAFRDTTGWNEFRALFARGKIRGIIFTSASSVRAFFEIMQRDHSREALLGHLARTRAVSIGPFTSGELRKLGAGDSVAEVHTVAGAFDEMKNVLTR